MTLIAYNPTTKICSVGHLTTNRLCVSCGTKKCSKCKHWKELSNFSKCSHKTPAQNLAESGRHCHCRPCKALIDKASKARRLAKAGNAPALL